jgi:hypothetical protein
MREYLLPWPPQSIADFARESIRIRQKTFPIAPQAQPVARTGAAGGSIPGYRREPSHDERRLVVILHPPYQAMR